MKFVFGLLALAAPIPLLGQVIPDTTRLPDRTTTAILVNAASGVAPMVTTILYGNDLRERGLVFVRDALREVAGISLVSGGSYGAFTSIFMRGGESDYVKVLLDGVPLNEPGGAIDLSNLNLDNIDRIEIVPGAASVLYGSDAVSGVIQLFTRKGSPKGHAELRANFGTFGSRDLGLAFSSQNKLLYQSGSVSEFRSNGTYPFNNKYRNRTISYQIGHNGPGGDRNVFTLRYGNALSHYPTDYTGIPVDSNQYDQTRNLALGLDLVRPASATAVFTAHGFASRLHRSSTNRPDSPGDTVGFAFQADRDAVTWKRGADLRMDFLRASGLRTTVGLNYTNEAEEQSSSTLSNFGGGIYEEGGPFDAHRNTFAGYTQLYATPTPFVTLLASARLDHNSAFGSNLTWRGGASIRNREGWRAWVSGGSAFKAPLFSELFANSAFEKGNPDLKSEHSNAFEIGIGRSFPDAKGLINLTAFTQRFTDLIQYVSAAPGDPTYTNLGAVRSRGLEASLWYKLSKQLTARGSLAWISTLVADTGAASSVTFEQGKSLLRRPALSGSLALEYRAGNTLIAGAISHVGKRDDADFRDFPTSRVTLSSYQTVDLSLVHTLQQPDRFSRGIDLTFRAENVFDARYEQVVAFPGRGRTLFAGVRLHQ